MIQLAFPAEPLTPAERAELRAKHLRGAQYWARKRCIYAGERKRQAHEEMIANLKAMLQC